MSEALEQLSEILRDKLPEEEVHNVIAKLTIASGNGSVSIGGNATEAVLIIGNNNRVTIDRGDSTETIRKTLQELLSIISQRPRQEKLLLNDVKKYAKGLLSKTLLGQSANRIILYKELQPELVNCPWNMDIKSSPNFTAFRSKQSTLLEIFEHDEIAGKLLIVGEPGSGKSTSLLELTETLIGRAEQHNFEPIPVLINLASWQYKQSIDEWIVETTIATYGGSKAIVKQWLKEQKILPMLDGLDELELSNQEACIRAINKFLSQENRPSSLVVCSRRDEYMNCKARLNLNGATCLLPLTNEQIVGYLQQIEDAPSWQTFSQDLVLLELLRVPLFLNVAIIAFDTKNAEQWEKIDSSEERRQYLWNTYISQRLGNCDKNDRMLIWLTWIAQQLVQKPYREEAQKVSFVVSEIQPYITLDKKHKKIYLLMLFVLILSIIEISFYQKNIAYVSESNSKLTHFNTAIVAITVMASAIKFIQLNENFIRSRIVVAIAIPVALFVGLISGRLYYSTPLSFSTSLIPIILNLTIIFLPLLMCLAINAVDLLTPDAFDAYSLSIKLFSWIAIIPSVCLQSIAKLLNSFKVFNSKSIFMDIYIFHALTFLIIITLSLTGLYNDIHVFALSIFLSVYIWFSFAFFGKLQWKWYFYYSILPSLLIIPSLLYFSIINSYFDSSDSAWYVGIISGLTFGQITQAILTTLIYKDSIILIAEKATHANEGIRKSFINASVVGITTTIIIGIIKDFSQGISLGLIFWLLNGGIACIQHLILRLILYSQGYIPWDYTKFLNYATERNLLQRIGGSYKFIHRLLQEHFVNIPLEANRKK
jgi:hypothetical protein